MAKNNYQPNSHKFREEQTEKEDRTKNQAVVSVSGKTKKKSGLMSFASNFIAEDASSVGSYIVTDVIIPKAKELFSAIVKQGLDMWLYGESRLSSSGSISYNKYYRDRDRDVGRKSAVIRDDRRSGLSFEEPILETRGDAEAVLDAMYDRTDEFGVVSIMDMYEFAGISSNNYRLSHFGWTRAQLRNVRIERQRDGCYLLRMPKAMVFDD